ncbi:ATP-binding protein [Micromonospora olivasterospora]|uniref:Anti-sigma regulatory factor (Ser/Thr protein kinase) n=1 Tax=Micromonospora olivasterospora TaxID=1880 RepID=A0A562IH66_MICOL|nr:ATP-binding protein [Micromonospora olivasterospora]TWH70168.1 anti-sigma regulatory factor (Ser/Thr protein kinase) [Micromonospora olivasterospora]
MSELTAHLDLPLGIHAPDAARRALTALLQGWGFRDEDWLDDAGVVISELVTNAVRHGGGCVEFAAEAHEGRVVLSVADGSSVVPRRRDPDGVGGRGIAVIEAMSASWGVHDHEGGKRVWVELRPCPGGPVWQPGSARGGQR